MMKWLMFAGVSLAWCPALLGASPVEDWVAWNKQVTIAHDVPQGACIGMQGDVILIAGGIVQRDGQSHYSDRVAVWMINGDGQVHEAATDTLLRPMAYAAAVATPQGLLCLGGENDDGPTDRIVLLRWDAQRNEVVVDTDWPALPHPTTRAGGAMLGGRIYLAAGLVDGQRSSQLLSLSLDEAARSWQEHEFLPGEARCDAVLIRQGAAESNCLFLIGGTSEAGALSDAYRFDPRDRSWQTIANPPVALGHPIATTLGSAHLLVADRAAPSATWLAYQTITDTWIDAPLPANEIHHAQAALTLDTGVVLLGDKDGAQAVIVGRLTPAGTSFKVLDYIAVAVYMLAMLLIGLYFTRRNQSTHEYFLAGNRIPWWAAGLSLLATQVSAIGFMAVPAKSFATNWAYFLGVFTWFLVVPVVNRFYIPHFRRFNVASAYSYLEQRFNVLTRMLAALAFCLLQIGRLAVVMLLPAMALATVTDLSMITSILLMGVIATIYTMTGGMHAVVWTDVVQAILLMGGALLAVVVVLCSLDGGLGQFTDIVAADDKFRLVLPTMDIAAASAWVVIVGNIFSRLSGLTSDQTIIQRYLITPDVRSARQALWVDVATSVPWAIIVFMLGTALYVYYKVNPAMLHPGVDTDGVVPLFIAQVFPPGMAGLMIAAIFAAAMSTLVASLHSTATVIVSDFYARFIPSSSEKTNLWLAKALVLVLGLFGSLLAIYMAQMGIKSIWDQFITIVGLFVGVLAGLFILGVFTVRTDGWDALIGAIAGVVATFYVSVYTRISFFLYPAVSIIVCVAVAYLLSFTPRQRQLDPSLTAYADKA
ncbi:MAG: sodium/solute symporter [Phycisphaeraceae bacterium]|nr:sodium/solute symporter [Phycisphaeraceae bacterium]